MVECDFDDEKAIPVSADFCGAFGFAAGGVLVDEELHGVLLEAVLGDDAGVAESDGAAEVGGELFGNDVIPGDDAEGDLGGAEDAIQLMAGFSAVKVDFAFLEGVVDRYGVGVAIVAVDAEDADPAVTEDGFGLLRAEELLAAAHASEHGNLHGNGGRVTDWGGFVQREGGSEI